MKLEKKIMRYMSKNGISKSVVAKKTGITYMTLSNIEKEKNSPCINTIEKILESLDLKLAIIDKDGNIL